MPEVCSNVTFENVAREIRAKWSGDSDKASLVAAQNVLNQHLAELKALGTVQRVVCGGCLDFKIIVKLPATKFGDWESASFAPEAAILEKLKAIPNISSVETQTYTLETL
ncbi:hypothetical protein ScalyP_jg6948 [Parmales sp. scaly parma]|nr:hypothetical protein ScalyP_jg6948 [Parmales sp. scaly parma]